METLQLLQSAMQKAPDFCGVLQMASQILITTTIIPFYSRIYFLS